MTSQEFKTEALNIYENYWRIKAANALVRSSSELGKRQFEYTNVPPAGSFCSDLGSESTDESMSALSCFIAGRLPRDLFFALIAEFETRIISSLLSLGEPDSGTLGTLQNRIQRRISISQSLVEDLNEVRERRNVMIHHKDIANSRYISTVSAVLPRANPFVKVTSVGDNVSPTDHYLGYATDVMIRYSNAIV